MLSVKCSYCGALVFAKDALYLKNRLAISKDCLRYCDKSLLTKAQLMILEKQINGESGVV